MAQQHFPLLDLFSFILLTFFSLISSLHFFRFYFGFILYIFFYFIATTRNQGFCMKNESFFFCRMLFFSSHPSNKLTNLTSLMSSCFFPINTCIQFLYCCCASKLLSEIRNWIMCNVIIFLPHNKCLIEEALAINVDAACCLSFSLSSPFVVRSVSVLLYIMLVHFVTTFLYSPTSSRTISFYIQFHFIIIFLDYFLFSLTFKLDINNKDGRFDFFFFLVLL